MLHRIDELLSQGVDFAFETTLASRSYAKVVAEAKQLGYSVTLVFFWLDSIESAIERVKHRVAQGGHSIPTEIIVRRYHRGMKNLCSIYLPLVDYAMIFNSTNLPSIVAVGAPEGEFSIYNSDIWSRIKNAREN